MNKTILDVVHDTAKALHDAGVMDAATLAELSVRRDIEAGLADARAGRVYSTEDVRSRLLPDTE